jgi:hypothetical protein
MKRHFCFAAAVAIVAPAIAGAVDLKPETVEAYNRYVGQVETRLSMRVQGPHFLWTDDVPALEDQLLRGVVAVRPANGSGLIAVKNGLIQDWAGAVYVPHCSLRNALDVVQDYGRHAEIYKPEITDSKLQSREHDEFHVYMRIVKAKFFLSAVFNTEHRIDFHVLDPRKVYSRSYSTRIAEVSGAGKSGEHELPVGQDRGLLWRLTSFWFFEERDGGVYIASESVSLTREIPLGMGKLLGPLIHDVPGESLENSLAQTRKAIAERAR